jgi:DNA-binding transcriptional regulator LsrR (DeoR family)
MILPEPGSARSLRAQGIQLDAEGNPLQATLSPRIVGIGWTSCGPFLEIIVTAYDRPKARAVRAVTRGGFVSTRITNASLAEELLPLQ